MAIALAHETCPKLGQNPSDRVRAMVSCGGDTYGSTGVMLQAGRSNRFLNKSGQGLKNSPAKCQLHRLVGKKFITGVQRWRGGRWVTALGSTSECN